MTRTLETVSIELNILGFRYLLGVLLSFNTLILLLYIYPVNVLSSVVVK